MGRQILVSGGIHPPLCLQEHDKPDQDMPQRVIMQPVLNDGRIEGGHRALYRGVQVLPAGTHSGNQVAMGASSSAIRRSQALAAAAANGPVLALASWNRQAASSNCLATAAANGGIHSWIAPRSRTDCTSGCDRTPSNCGRLP